MSTERLKLEGFDLVEAGVFRGRGLAYTIRRCRPGYWIVEAPDCSLVASDVEGLDRATQVATEHALRA